jgi:hypothetical protein
MTVSLPKPNLSPKSSLLSGLEGQVDLYVCPESLSPLKRIRRFYGLYEEDYLVSQDFKGTKYRVYPGSYIDLTIKSEVDRPVWSLSLRERVGQNFFQTRLIPAIYERGYRQNFENIGFPGIDKEFEEANDLFTASKASTVLDLSCGSGFMTRKFVASNKYVSKRDWL